MIDAEEQAIVQRHEAISDLLDAIRDLLPVPCRITLVAIDAETDRLHCFLSDDDLQEVAHTMQAAMAADELAVPIGTSMN